MTVEEVVAEIHELERLEVLMQIMNVFSFKSIKLLSYGQWLKPAKKIRAVVKA